MSSLTSGHSMHNMPKEIFCEIFSYISEDFEELFKCRQVCKNWNENIRDMIELKRFRRNAAEKIRSKWSDEVFLPSEPEISFAKSLVKSGHLDVGVLVNLEERFLFFENLMIIDASKNLPFEEFWKRATELYDFEFFKKQKMTEQQESVKVNAAERIQVQWSRAKFIPSFADIIKAYSLARSGHLGNEVLVNLEERMFAKIKSNPNSEKKASLSEIETAARCVVLNELDLGEVVSFAISGRNCSLKDVDLSSIPANLLQALAMQVTRLQYIQNVFNTDLSPIFRGLGGCQQLKFRNQILSNDNTMALVVTMESWDTVNQIVFGEDVNVDIQVLTEYSGQGSCKLVVFDEDSAYSYRNEVEDWGKRINWTFRDLHIISMNKTFYGIIRETQELDLTL